MYSRLNLISGRQRNVVVKRMSDHLDPTYWPSVLSSTVEELLFQQMLQTVQEVTKLIREQGASVDQISDEAEALRTFLGDGKGPQRPSAKPGKGSNGLFQIPFVTA